MIMVAVAIQSQWRVLRIENKVLLSERAFLSSVGDEVVLGEEALRIPRPCQL